MESFIENLNIIRTANGWNVRELAEHCRMTREEMSRLLNGRRKPNIDTCIDIANALELGLHELFDPNYKNLISIS